MNEQQSIDLGAFVMGEWTVMLHDRVITRFTIHEGDRLTVGRGDEADVLIDNPAVSRLHATLELRNGLHFLTDLESTNGTTVNGQRIGATVPISDQDKVFIGKFQLVPQRVDNDRSSRSYATAMDLDDRTVFVSSAPPSASPAEPPPSLEKHQLVVIGGEASPNSLSLAGKETVSIGKAPGCDLIIAGFLVAREQCRIVRRQNRFFLVPQRSWATTRLNEVSFKGERMLRPGDVIAIRRVRIRFD